MKKKARKLSDNIKEADRVVLGDGEDCIFSTDTNISGINNNILVVGGSGSGKTVSIAESFLLESYNRNIITTVTKRRIVNKYIPLLEKRGYNVWDLDFVHPENGNVGYDPLDFIKSYQDIVFIAKSIVTANKKKENTGGDPYWDEAATSLFSAIISYVLMRKENPNFSDVLEMLDKLSFEEEYSELKTNYDSKFDRLEKINPFNFATVNWRSFRRLPIRTASCVFSTLNTSISFVFTPELRKMFKMENKISFEKMAREKRALFVTTSPVNPSLNSFINMFYAHIFKELFEIGERESTGVLPVPIHFLADDFATGCPVPLFDQYISIFREKGISVTILVQSESQLSAIYGNDKSTTIINNCDTYVYMGSNDLETAKNIAMRAGIMTEDCLNMKLGNQIIFRRGVKPIFCKRYNIFENEIYKGLKDCPQEVLDTTDCFVQERKSFISELKNSIKMCKLDDIPDDSMEYERISFLKEEDLGLDSVYKNLFEEDTDDF
nr:type IV secretory system conjugative DNA transfer family protein [uncultured Lachnoanaerobaculum sp.]